MRVEFPEPTRPQAERVMVISLMKSGTHLIQELMIALGYGIYGQSRIPAEARPRLSRETRRRIAEMVYGKEAFAELELQTVGAQTFDRATEEAWKALGWAWQVRFGLPLVSHYGIQLINTELVAQALRQTASSAFAQTPPRVCWIFPELDMMRIDGRFVQEWSDTGQPKIIFMYRDPRDTTLSMVNFLMGKTRQGFGAFSDFTVFHRILQGKQGIEQRLEYALSDDAFPGISDHRRMRWLLHHPDVCTVSFEGLIGADGGGSTEAQTGTVARILKFLGSNGDPQELSGRLFRRDSFTFYKGQIGAWREVFTDKHARLAKDRFGDVLTDYGYAW